MLITDGFPWLLIVLLFIEGGLFLTMSILWFRSMNKAMAACHPVSRSAEPDSVWLNFIPIFGLFWQFICVTRISESLAREYHRRGWHSDEDRPARELGIVTGVVICLAFAVRVILPTLHPGIGFFITLAMCFCMFRHIDRLNSYRERLEKELDPTTAFGQIPVLQQVMPTVFQPQLVLPVTEQTMAEQLRSSYANIPFVPQTPFVPAQNNVPVPTVPANDFSKYMPPVENPKSENTTTEQTENDSNNPDRWAPPSEKS